MMRQSWRRGPRGPHFHRSRMWPGAAHPLSNAREKPIMAGKLLRSACVAAALVAADAACANEGLVSARQCRRRARNDPRCPPVAKRSAGGKAKPAIEAAPTASEAAPAAPWGAVPTDKISLANLAPGLLVYFNNGPVFGLPGTVTGPLGERTQLLGDWGGTRTELARQGFFFDLYSTSTIRTSPLAASRPAGPSCRTPRSPSTSTPAVPAGGPAA